MAKRKDKAKSQRGHAKRRAKDRFDVHLSDPQLDAIVTDIQNNKLEFLERQSNRTTVWRGRLGDKAAIIVYDSQRKEIVTFIDPSSPLFEDGRVKLELEGCN